MEIGFQSIEKDMLFITPGSCPKTPNRANAARQCGWLAAGSRINCSRASRMAPPHRIVRGMKK